MSQHDKIYKAIIFDCDGTLIKNEMNGLPSQGVTDAINKASQIVHVGIATSRPIFLAKPILKHLKLSGPSIIAGGAQIIDGESLEILKEQQIERKDIVLVLEVFKKFNLKYFAHDGINEDKERTPDSLPKKAIEMAVMRLDIETADKVMEDLSKIEGVTAHKIVSWQENKRDINITHVSSTKHHGVLEVARRLNIDTQQIIGVGDGYNDFPLLMACGLKIAMGNAVQDLKEIADYIAPSVEQDGVVDIVNKYIL
jgi:HAD superfamily hydrolase (TIGR01484 family)